ncbi:hypothetical protein [Halorussus marinus]|uniref:hypothetical protein n=1 Tax=Halorussus marinus TaxID=2505976 RepID=UPI00106EF96A|nr:hypothetical protein [Halorussus marinus]
MTDENATRTMRDTFVVWNVDAVEREVVLRSSDDQHVAVPLPAGERDRFEALADGSGTVDATLAATDDGPTSWRIDAIHAVDR